MPLVLGIDVGTTSVKICIISADEVRATPETSPTKSSASSKTTVVHKNKSISNEVNRDGSSLSSSRPITLYCSHFPYDQSKLNSQRNRCVRSEVKGEKACEHCPETILKAVQQCLATIPSDLCRQITSIGFCGQMHSCMYLDTRRKRGGFTAYDATTQKYHLTSSAVYSPLFSWQDGRSGSEFLNTLPIDHLRPFPSLHSGFGCATTAWFVANDKKYLENFDCMTTIMDWIVWIVGSISKPAVSDQLAASFGFYDLTQNDWNHELFKQIPQFPTSMLPRVHPSGSIVATLSDNWMGIAKGTPVYIPLGDTQCAIYSVLSGPHNQILQSLESSSSGNRQSAVLNCGTSMQLATTVSREVAFLYQKHQDVYWALKYDKMLRKSKHSSNELRRRKRKVRRPVVVVMPSDSESISLQGKSDSSIQRSVSSSGTLESLEAPSKTKLEVTITSGSVGPPPALEKTAEMKSPAEKICSQTHIGNMYKFDRKMKAQKLPGPMDHLIHLRQAVFQDRALRFQVQNLISEKCFECITFFPYFNDQYLAIAASLNGGNVLASYIRLLHDHIEMLTDSAVSEELIWKRLLESSHRRSAQINSRQRDHFIVNPLLNGERHTCDQALAVFNIHRNNFNFGLFFEQLCKSLVVNIFRMFPVYLLKRFDVKRVIAVGNTFVQNTIMQEYLKQRLQKQRLQMRLESQCDADYGVALITAKFTRKIKP